MVQTQEDVDDTWLEFNCTVQEIGDLSIYEPCYYASNMAYYHTLVELCAYDDWRVGDDYGMQNFFTYAKKNLRKKSVLSTALSMIQNFAFLAFESAFFHGSATDVGAAGDVKLNDLFTFLAYQVCIYFFLFHFYDAHFFWQKLLFTTTQAATSQLEPLDSSKIHDLSTDGRSLACLMVEMKDSFLFAILK